jgi:hypothetical protein
VVPLVAEQTGLHVLDPQRLAQQRVVEHVDLADRQFVARHRESIASNSAAVGSVIP